MVPGFTGLPSDQPNSRLRPEGLLAERGKREEDKKEEDVGSATPGRVGCD
jgi:hypothetical protein